MLGGGIAQQGESLLSAFGKKRLRAEIYTKDSEVYATTQLKEAVLGNDAGIVGTGALAWVYNRTAARADIGLGSVI